MFGNCVWLQLSSTNNLNQNILNFSRLFGTPNFKAHITLEYNIKQPFDKNKYKIDDVIVDGYPYFTNKNGFFSCQQNYFFKDEPKKIYHISLAYKVDKEFTYQEIEFLRTIKIDEFISKKEFEIHLWNCNSKNPNLWKMIS